ncbi:hypothetical protein [Segetibacter aerophilus]|uniref:Uncharacterized protein n=1 Tax=Segetibacter aerophilus TaxID=670293 RepID=A0A512B9X7_9BACT|nr:hypothetical protein [Segetibacter aerophilus]GEO08743.1 hypothetical protein SAE01_12390 [Segetibacter aerophilus]
MAVKSSKVSSKQKRVADITEMLASGMERKEILRKVSKTCKVSSRTIDNEIKEAKEILKKRQLEAEEIRLRVRTKMTEDAVKEGLKSDLELELILSQIACANVEVEDWVKGEVVMRSVSPMESIAAIDKIFKKRGSYAPIKQANTDKSGNDVEQPRPYSKDELLLILHKANG